MGETRLQPSRIIAGTRAPEAPGVPLITAFGEPDDHLRLTVLLARQFGTHAGSLHLREAAETCLSAKVPWKQRHEALAELLRHPPRVAVAGYCVALVDLDALDPGPLQGEGLWDDRLFGRQRREFLETVIGAIRAGGWLVVRSKPSSHVSLQLDGLVGTEELEPLQGSSATPELGVPLDLLSPDCRPVLTWLVRGGVLRARDVDQILEAAGLAGFEEHILDVAYDTMPAYARDAAKRLCALRGPQAMNGTLGPFQLGPDQREAPSEEQSLLLEKRAIDCLLQAGFLQPTKAPSGHEALRMPRAIRSHLVPLARLGMPSLLQAQHRALGARALETLPLEEQLETHFHAINGGEWKDALRTARYYAADLRELAFRLSHDEKRYAEAAEIYRTIVIEFDSEDAYAWEYFAYNLALACGQELPSPEQAREIESAYRRACELDRANPLYHGRLLGFRAWLGEDVLAEFHQGMRRYLFDHAEQPEAVSYFAEPVLRGLLRGKRPASTEVVKRWRPLLQRFERLHQLLGERS